MYFPLVFQVISGACFAITLVTPFIVCSDYTRLLIGQFLVFIPSATFRTPFTFAVHTHNSGSPQTLGLRSPTLDNLDIVTGEKTWKMFHFLLDFTYICTFIVLPSVYLCSLFSAYVLFITFNIFYIFNFIPF